MNEDKTIYYAVVDLDDPGKLMLFDDADRARKLIEAHPPKMAARNFRAVRGRFIPDGSMVMTDAARAEAESVLEALEWACGEIYNEACYNDYDDCVCPIGKSITLIKAARGEPSER